MGEGGCTHGNGSRGGAGAGEGKTDRQDRMKATPVYLRLKPLKPQLHSDRPRTAGGAGRNGNFHLFLERELRWGRKQERRFWVTLWAGSREGGAPGIL